MALAVEYYVSRAILKHGRKPPVNFAKREGDMSGQTRYRILTSDGCVSFDVFTVAAEQPPEADGDWLLMDNNYTGKPMMVHATRLIPLAMPRSCNSCFPLRRAA